MSNQSDAATRGAAGAVDATLLDVAPADLSIIAARANEAHLRAKETAACAVVFAIEAGKALADAKQIVGHGGWGKWLSDNVSASAFGQVGGVWVRLAEGGAQ